MIDSEISKIYSNGEDTCTEILDVVFKEYEDTPIEHILKVFVDIVKKNYHSFQGFLSAQQAKVQELLLQSFPPDTEYTEKNAGVFLKHFHTYMSSDEYKASAISVLKIYNVSTTGPEFQLLSSIMFHIEKESLNNVRAGLNLQPTQWLLTVPTDAQLSAGGRGKVRYIAGYVIAKLRYRISKRVRNLLFAKGKEDILKKMQGQMQMLSSLCISYEELLDATTDRESLLETARKQNNREGLTNISDKTFQFFVDLEKLGREKLSSENLASQGKHLYKFALTELKSDLTLFEMWTWLFQTVPSESQEVDASDNDDSDTDVNFLMSDLLLFTENSLDLFNLTIALFVKVSLSQLRRTILTSLKREKMKALRKRVTERSKKAQQASAIDMKFINKDSSENKMVTHLKLKAEISENPHYLTSRKFTKKDLGVLCKAYGLKISSQKKEGRNWNETWRKNIRM